MLPFHALLQYFWTITAHIAVMMMKFMKISSTNMGTVIIIFMEGSCRRVQTSATAAARLIQGSAKGIELFKQSNFFIVDNFF